MNAKRRAASLLLGVLLAACAGTPTTPTPAGSSPLRSPGVLNSLAPTAQPATPKPTFVPSPTPAPSASSSAKPTPVPVPPKPTGVSFDEQVKELAGDPATGWTPRHELTYTVTWQAPRSEGITVRVYGVTECLSMPIPAPEIGDGPCLVEHTRLPSAAIRLVATASASSGRASWTAEDQADCRSGPAIGPDGTSFPSVVLAAYGASGQSIFAIAVTGSWCTGCAVC